MKNKKSFVFCAFAFLLAASHIFLGLQIINFRRAFSLELDESRNAFVKQIEAVETEIQMLSDRQSQESSEIQERLASLNAKSAAQFKETVEIKQTYDGILAENKKKTVDTASQDAAILRLKKDAERYYSERNYGLAYKEFKKVAAYQPDDYESRLKKMKSLYYKNRADSSNYKEILEDIRILKSNGCCDDEAGRIEKSIVAEREGISE